MWEIPIAVIYTAFFIDFFIAFFYMTIFIIIKFKKQNEIVKYLNLTFVLPAFNSETTLEDSVNSIKRSDYLQDKIKIIIVNDGSTDNTLRIANKLAKKYPGIKIFSKKNSGSKAAAVNYGLKRAGTELVAVLDADTIIKPDLLKRAIALFSNETMVAVTARFKPLNNSKLIEKLQDVEYALAGFYRMLIGHINSLPIAPAFTIFKRDFFLKHGYFEEGNLTEDFEMGLRIQSKHYNMGYIAHSYAVTGVPENLKKLYKQRIRWGYGTFYNYKKYKKLFFNRKYGDLGVFILPSAFISILMVSSVFLMGIYNALKWIIEHIQMLLIGWRPTFTTNLDRIVLYITDLKFLLFFFAVVLGTSIFLLTRSEMKEKIKIRYYLLTISIYLWLLAFFYVVSIFKFVRGKKPKW